MAAWYRRVLLLALPLILSNLTQPLLSTVDTILSGHLPGAAALGGVAMGGIFFNAIYWTFGFLRMSTTGLVAQAYGARRHSEMRLHFVRALLAALAIGLFVLAIKEPFIALAIRFLGASPEVAVNAAVYCHIRIWSAPAALANYAILGYLLGHQRARMALLLQTAVNVINVVVALTLVLGLHWGVAGIATGTMVADWAGCLIGLLLSRDGWLPEPAERHLLRWRDLLHGPSLRHLFALNRDLLLRTLSLVAAYAWFTRTGAREGDTVLAANAILMNMHFIASYGLDGFANATETLVGEAIGAQNHQDYRAILRTSTVSALIVAAFASFVYIVAGPSMIGWFTNQPSVRALTLRFLPWAMALPVLSVWGFQMDGVFVGATRGRDLRDAMLLSFTTFLVLAIGLERLMGNHGLWCAFCCFMVVRGVSLGLRLPRIERAFVSTAVC